MGNGQLNLNIKGIIGIEKSVKLLIYYSKASGVHNIIYTRNYFLNSIYRVKILLP